MVSTHQQYLCPDFLNPSPPTTVDSSPLALLAQTCNSIGLPDPPTSVSGSATGGKSSKGESTKSSSEKHHHHHHHAKDETSSKSASSSKKTTTSIADSSSDSSTTAANRSSPKEQNNNNGHRSPAEVNQKSDAALKSASRQANVSSSDSSKARSPEQSSSTDTQSTVSAVGTSTASTSLASSSVSSASSLLLNKCIAGSSNPLATFPVTGFPPALFPSYFPTNSNPAASAFPYVAAHMGSLGLPAGAASCYPPFPSTAVPSASNLWLPSPLPGFAPKCMDPFCKTCPAIGSGMRGPCGAVVGCPCVQCGGGVGGHSAATGDFPFWLPSYSSLFGQTVAGLHGGSAAANPASMYAAAAAVAAAAAHQQHTAAATTAAATVVTTSCAANQPPATPVSAASGAAAPQQHTCSWMTGNEFCGKRFPSSEELLQHLRSHTSQDSAAAAAAAAAAASTNPASSLSTPVVTAAAAAAAAAAHFSAAAASGRLSPRSTYLNSINSLRYHPYGKLTPTGASAAAALASLPFPASALNPAAAQFNPLSALCSTLSQQRLPASLPHQ